MILFLAISLLFISGSVNKLFMDGPYFKASYFLNKYKWFNPIVSSNNKWALGREGNKISIKTLKDYWYYLGFYKPEYKERFWFSSTFFVFVTNAWHCGKFISYGCYELLLTLLLDGGIHKGVFSEWYFIVLGFFLIKGIRCAGFNSMPR